MVMSMLGNLLTWQGLIDTNINLILDWLVRDDKHYQKEINPRLKPLWVILNNLILNDLGNTVLVQLKIFVFLLMYLLLCCVYLIGIPRPITELVELKDKTKLPLLADWPIEPLRDPPNSISILSNQHHDDDGNGVSGNSRFWFIRGILGTSVCFISSLQPRLIVDCYLYIDFCFVYRILFAS